MTQDRDLKKITRDGKFFWVDAKTGELVSESKRIEIEEANKRKHVISEPQTNPLTDQQQKLKTNVQLMGLTADEADVFARGRQH